MRNLIAAISLAVGCSDLTAPDGAVPIVPIPVAYRAWWGAIESCSGLRGDIDRVQFFLVAEIPGHPERIAQTTVRPDGRAIILLRPVARDLEWAVKHEIVHALLRDDGHPSRYFREVCGNLMPD